MTIPVAVVGASGRMGSTTCTAVAADPDLELVAAVGHWPDGPDQLDELEAAGCPVSDDVEDVHRSGARVVVDFTNAAAAREHLPRLADWGVHAVVGTTGLGPADLDSLRAAFRTSNCVVAA